MWITRAGASCLLAAALLPVTGCEALRLLVGFVDIDSFVASPEAGGAPLTVTFSFIVGEDEESSANGVLDFGDGTRIDVSVPRDLRGTSTHTYAEPGEYVARLRLLGSREEKQVTVRVLAADFRCQPLAVDELLLPPDGIIDEAYPGFQFTTTSAEGAITWSLLSGALPPGLSLSADGTVSGTPAQEGTFIFSLQVVDSCPLGVQTAEHLATIIVRQPLFCLALDMTPEPGPPPGTVGQAYLFLPTITGGLGTPTLSVGGSSPGPLPPGLSINGRVVEGTPTEEGTFEVHLVVTDECPLGAQTDVTGFTFTINPGGCPRLDVVAGTQPPQITLGGSFDFVVPVNGGFAPVTLRISSQGDALPPGCTFDGTRVTGTPSATGVFQVLIEATDSCPGGVQFDAEFFDFVINP